MHQIKRKSKEYKTDAKELELKQNQSCQLEQSKIDLKTISSELIIDIDSIHIAIK